MILLMYKAKVFTILFLSTVLVGVYGQTPVFLVHPVSTAAIDGTTVEFTCTAENANLALSYVVNDTVEQVFIDRGFTQSNIESLGNNTFMRNLTVTVSAALNNNSEIACVAVGIGASAAESNIATLTIQGLLSSVGDLSYTYIDSSTVNISWSPPFTLPGTYITGYNISVTSNGTITNYFTFNTNYELLLTDITNSSCNEINITVSGYNGLNGENSLLSEMYLPNLPQVEIIRSIQIIVIQVYESFSVNVSNIMCPGEFPTHLMLLEAVTESYICSTPLQPSQTMSYILVSTDPYCNTSVNGNQNMFLVTLSNIAGDFDIAYDLLIPNTRDITSSLIILDSITTSVTFSTFITTTDTIITTDTIPIITPIITTSTTSSSLSITMSGSNDPIPIIEVAAGAGSGVLVCIILSLLIISVVILCIRKKRTKRSSHSTEENMFEIDLIKESQYIRVEESLYDRTVHTKIPQDDVTHCDDTANESVYDRTIHVTAKHFDNVSCDNIHVVEESLYDRAVHTKMPQDDMSCYDNIVKKDDRIVHDDSTCDVIRKANNHDNTKSGTGIVYAELGSFTSQPTKIDMASVTYSDVSSFKPPLPPKIRI